MLKEGLFAILLKAGVVRRFLMEALHYREPS